jgi:hypothetical protein
MTVPTNNDVLNEATETYNISVGGVSAIGTITDNDPTLPTLSIDDVTVVENIAGGLATFTVTLSTASGQTVTVVYNTSNGTAVQPGDYTSTTNTITFLPGQTSQTITVPINNDTTDETSETFFVNLVTPTNATIADNLGVGTIIDNDNAPTIASITSATQIECIPSH